MGLLNSLLGLFKIEIAPAGTAKDLIACNVSEAHVQDALDTATSKLGTANTALGACTEGTTVQQQTIAQQAATIQQQTDEITQLNVKAVNARRELWLEPCPALLQEVPASKVMLGEIYMTTALGSFWLAYPTHPSIFTPGPVYEQTLTDADCNRVRADIGGQEIAIKIANQEQQHMTYDTDQHQYNVPDCWMVAVLAKLIGKDDCETLATNILNALFYRILQWGVFPNHSPFLGLGHLKEGPESFGHGFDVLLHKTSTALTDSYIIEATLNFEADPMTLQEAKDTYDIDWGMIGWVRDAHPDGTYWFRADMNWWGTTGAARPGCHCVRCMKKAGKVAQAVGFFGRLKRMILHEPSDEDRKRAIIAKKWESKRRR